MLGASKRLLAIESTRSFPKMTLQCRSYERMLTQICRPKLSPVALQPRRQNETRSPRIPSSARALSSSTPKNKYINTNISQHSLRNFGPEKSLSVASQSETLPTPFRALKPQTQQSARTFVRNYSSNTENDSINKKEDTEKENAVKEDAKKETPEKEGTENENTENEESKHERELQIHKVIRGFGMFGLYFLKKITALTECFTLTKQRIPLLHLSIGSTSNLSRLFCGYSQCSSSALLRICLVL